MDSSLYIRCPERKISIRAKPTLKRRLLFVCPSWGKNLSFVQTDLRLLQAHYDVTLITAGDKRFPVRFLKYSQGRDAVVVWFADSHAYWAVNMGHVLGIPVMLIPAHYEVVSLPEFGYGLKVENRWRWQQSRSALRRADAVVAFSEYHRQKIVQSTALPTRVHVVPHGWDPEEFRPLGPKKRIVATVSHAQNVVRMRIKGLETFARTAAMIDGAQFVHGGFLPPDIADHLQRLSLGHIELRGPLVPSAVIKLLQEAKVYCQLSAIEGFGCAMAEAMFCACIPVIVDCGGLREVAGDNAVYVSYGDVEGTALAVQACLNKPQGAGQQYRDRMVTLYPLEAREQRLVSILDGMFRR